MQKVLIRVGDKIEMTHVKSATRRKLSENVFASMLLDYNGVRTAKISMPIYEGRVIPLEIGDEYSLCFFSSSGLYRCRARIKSRLREGNIFVLMMEFLSMPKKFQRRQFFRLDCLLSIHYRQISDEEKVLHDYIETSKLEENELEACEKKLEELSSAWEDAVLTDISGGGVRLQCQEKVEPGTYIQVNIPLDMPTGVCPFSCMAKVVHVIDLKGSEHPVELRCEFDNIGREQREFVVKYVFEEQKRRLRKD